MVCPLCRVRRARRACPALGQQICAVCCGTKRLTEIRCPGDCPYLATARDHPAAAVVRQQQRDLGLIAHFLRDFNQRQSQLFLLISTFLVRYQPPELQRCVDDDVAQAVEALAATFETASRGVIYEHRPASGSAGRLASALKALLAEAAGQTAGSAFERDTIVVLRRVEEASREARALEPGNGCAFLDLLTRLSRAPAGPAEGAASPGSLGSQRSDGSNGPQGGGDPDPSRLIVL
jgi:hypothetical protein